MEGEEKELNDNDSNLCYYACLKGSASQVFPAPERAGLLFWRQMVARFIARGMRGLVLNDRASVFLHAIAACAAI